MIDLTRQVHHLEPESKSSRKGIEEGGEIGEGGSEQVRNDLKTSMGLTSASDILSEDIIRLKVGLEQTGKVDAKVSESGQLASVQIADRPAASNAVATPEPGEEEPATAKPPTSPRLKTKLQVSNPKIKKEAKVAKKVQDTQWAPVGYYFVKAVKFSIATIPKCKLIFHAALQKKGSSEAEKGCCHGQGI